MTAPTIHSRQRCHGLASVAKRLGLSPGQEPERFKAFREKAKDGDSITLSYGETGLSYAITKDESHCLLVVSYTENTPVCSVYFNFKYPTNTKEGSTIARSVENFAAMLGTMLRDNHDIPAYLEWRFQQNPKGMRVFIIGADAAKVEAPAHSLARALKESGAAVQVRIVDKQRGAA